MRIGTSLYIESFNKIKIPFYSGSFSSSFSSFNRDYIRSIPFFACIYYEHNYNLFCQVFWYKTANIYRATFVLSISYVIYKMYIWLEQGDFVHTITWIHIYLYIIWLTTSQLSGGNEGGGHSVEQYFQHTRKSRKSIVKTENIELELVCLIKMCIQRICNSS